MSTGQIVMTMLFGGFGAAMVAGGAAMLIKTRRFVAAANRTPGKVVAHETRTSESTDDDNRSVQKTYYHPIIEFKDASGVQRRVTSDTGSNPKSYADGAAVTVLYDQDDPEKAKIESFGQLWLMPAILLGMGLIFLIITICIWVFNIPVSMGSG